MPGGGVGQQIAVRDLTGQARLGPLHIIILAVCFLTAIVDGWDNQVIGFTAAAIAPALGVPLARFGEVFSAGLVGTLVGAVAMGRLGDSIGRRRALIVCTIVFALFTAATPLAGTILQLDAVRFLGGLGLGGAMPCFLTLVSEYAPKTRKALATGLLWCGYPIGGVVGALIGSRVLAHDGWQTIYYLGGATALLVSALQWLLLPESLQFLVLHRARQERVSRVVRRLAPRLDLASVHLIADEATGERTRLRDVFADGRLVPTILLWIPLFITFMMTTCMVLWMPGLLKTAGMPLATAALMQAIGNLASLPSMAGAGFVLDRAPASRILPFTYAALALAFILLAIAARSTPVVAVAMVLIGLLQGPGIAGMLSLATSFYPSQVRTTGVGLAMGIGRSGQVAASLLIGWIIAQGVGVTWTITSMAAPPLVASFCVILLGRRLRNDRRGLEIRRPSRV
jgi:AAHS family 4-hydroxybenzoate transporter-like MFS transporter